jgi:hypothetical protein
VSVTMPVIAPPRFAKHLSPFMFSAALVGPLAQAGLPGVEAATGGAELLPEEVARGPLLVQ